MKAKTRPLPSNIFPEANDKLRVRVMIDGTIHGGYHDDLETAVKEKTLLLDQRKGRAPVHVPGDAEHQRQVSLLPSGTNYSRNIHRRRQGNGYNVSLTRGMDIINGGFYSGPDALSRAVECRDKLEKLYPSTRR